MTTGGNGAVPVGPAPPGRRRWIPFWALQATEIGVAVVYVDVSVHVSGGGLLLAAALAFAALAVTARGALGIVALCSQRLHLVMTSTVAALVALAPIVPALRPDRCV